MRLKIKVAIFLLTYVRSLFINKSFGRSLLSDENNSNVNSTESEWWEVERENHTTFNTIPHSQNLFLKRVNLDNTGIHSCYQYALFELETGSIVKTNTFCYPSVVVTGVRKCATSATYQLLALYPTVITTPVKENCAYLDGRTIIEYFDSLPREIHNEVILVDGCVHVQGNMKLRKMLRIPNTFYLVVVRDFSDWIWSAYNFWCSSDYDNRCNPMGRAVLPGSHERSPEAFHDIVINSLNTSKPPPLSPLWFKRPCDSAFNMFRSFVNKLWNEVPVEETLVISSEELEKNPKQTWNRIALAIGFETIHPFMKSFEKVRYNTQVSSKSKGENKKVRLGRYQPGLYASSDFKPLNDSTRVILNKCWFDDCIWSSLVTGHRYPSCLDNNSFFIEPRRKRFDRKLAPIAIPYIKETTQQFNESFDALLNYVMLNCASRKSFPFLLRPVAKCLMSITTIRNTRGLEFNSPKLTLSNGESPAISSSINNLFSRKTTSTMSKNFDFFQNGILLLASDRQDAFFIRSYVRYTTGYENIYDPYNDYDSTSRLHRELCTVDGPIVIIATVQDLKMWSVIQNTNHHTKVHHHNVTNKAISPNAILSRLNHKVKEESSLTPSTVNQATIVEHLTLQDHHAFKCTRPSIRVFKKVIYLSKDTMMTLMNNEMNLQRSLNDVKDIKNNVSYFDWTMWEEHVHNIVNIATRETAKRQQNKVSNPFVNLHFFANQNPENIAMSDAMYGFGDEDILVVEMDFIIESLKAGNTSQIYSILDFIIKSIAGKDWRHKFPPGSQLVAEHALLESSALNSNSYQCALIILTVDGTVETYQNRRDEHLRLAYSSAITTCQVMKYYHEYHPINLYGKDMEALKGHNAPFQVAVKSNSITHLATQGLNSNMPSLSCSNPFIHRQISMQYCASMRYGEDIPPPQEEHNKCVSRYENVTFLQHDTDLIPSLLIAAYGPEIIRARLLFEFATGVYTGSLESNVDGDLFKGESRCSFFESLIYANMSDGSIIPDYQVKVYNGSLEKVLAFPYHHTKKRCTRVGFIKYFDKAVVMIQDPLIMVWEFYLKRHVDILAQREAFLASHMIDMEMNSSSTSTTTTTTPVLPSTQLKLEEEELISIASNFSISELVPFSILNISSYADIVVVSHQLLFHPFIEIVPNPTTLQRVLSVIKLSGSPIADKANWERLVCSYKYLVKGLTDEIIPKLRFDSHYFLSQTSTVNKVKAIIGAKMSKIQTLFRDLLLL